MASWRDAASPHAQDDLDGLLNTVLPFAEQTIAKTGELYPFGAALATDGQVQMLAGDPSQGDHPASQSVLDALYEHARQSAGLHRAVAFVADVRASDSDAIRVELEHREGAALAVLAPYTRSRFKKAVTLGRMTVSSGQTRIWTDV